MVRGVRPGRGWNLPELPVHGHFNNRPDMDVEGQLAFHTHAFTGNFRRENWAEVVATHGAGGVADGTQRVVDTWLTNNWARVMDIVDHGQLRTYVSQTEFETNVRNLGQRDELFLAMPHRVKLLMTMWRGTSFMLGREQASMPAWNPVPRTGFSHTLMARSTMWAYDNGLIGNATVSSLWEYARSVTEI